MPDSFRGGHIAGVTGGPPGLAAAFFGAAVLAAAAFFGAAFFGAAAFVSPLDFADFFTAIASSPQS